jgi:1-acyl-sn-glycerol-3-phosphate acyltransferase
LQIQPPTLDVGERPTERKILPGISLDRLERYAFCKGSLAVVRNGQRTTDNVSMWILAIGGLLAATWLLQWQRSGQPAFEFGCLAIMRVYARLYHNLWIRRHAELPATGPALVIANHTCSADPAFLQACTARAMSFLIAAEYFNLPVVHRLFRRMQCVPVARSGQDVRTIRVALRRLQEGRIVCLFPEGSLSGTGRGRLRRAKRGAALLALRSGVPVYPVFITGGPEHTYVPSAWLLPSRAGIVIGRPVDLSPYRRQRIDRRLLERVGEDLIQQILALDPHAGKARSLPPLGENPHDRKRRRARKKALPAL